MNSEDAGERRDCPERFGDIRAVRDRLAVTQKEMAELLGTSTRAVQSYEQGWRQPPPAVERMAVLLLHLRSRETGSVRPCWELRNCPPEAREQCPSCEFGQGEFCWMVTGNCCEGRRLDSWREKAACCEACPVLRERARP